MVEVRWWWWWGRGREWEGGREVKWKEMPKNAGMKSFIRSLPIRGEICFLSLGLFMRDLASKDDVCVSVRKSSGVDASAAKRFIICLHELVLCCLSSPSLFEREWVSHSIHLDDCNYGRCRWCRGTQRLSSCVLWFSLVLRVECAFSFPPVCLTFWGKESVRGPEEEMFSFLLRFVSTLL